MAVASVPATLPTRDSPRRKLRLRHPSLPFWHPCHLGSVVMSDGAPALVDELVPAYSGPRPRCCSFDDPPCAQRVRDQGAVRHKLRYLDEQVLQDVAGRPAADEQGRRADIGQVSPPPASGIVDLLDVAGMTAQSNGRAPSGRSGSARVRPEQRCEPRLDPCPAGGPLSQRVQQDHRRRARITRYVTADLNSVRELNFAPLHDLTLLTRRDRSALAW